jgi:hypothetical protein
MLEPAMSTLNHKLLTIRLFMNTLGPEASRLPSGIELRGKFFIAFCQKPFVRVLGFSLTNGNPERRAG